MAEGKKKGSSIAKLLGGVRWEFVADRDEVSLLEPMQRYFDDFPWEGGPRQEDGARHIKDDKDLDFSRELDKEDPVD